MKLAKNVFMRVNIEHVLFEELYRLRPELKQPAFLTNNIEKFLGLKRLKKLNPGNEYDTTIISDMVEQFEALYCYAISKSILMSEIEEENPQYACLVKGYFIERSNLK